MVTQLVLGLSFSLQSDLLLSVEWEVPREHFSGSQEGKGVGFQKVGKEHGISEMKRQRKLRSSHWKHLVESWGTERAVWGDGDLGCPCTANWLDRRGWFGVFPHLGPLGLSSIPHRPGLPFSRETRQAGGLIPLHSALMTSSAHQLPPRPQCPGLVHGPAQSSFCGCAAASVGVPSAPHACSGPALCRRLATWQGVLPWRCSWSRGETHRPKSQDPVMNPLGENKWETREEDLIQGGEAPGRKLVKSYPDAKRWEWCLKEREEHRKRSGDESCE